MIETVPFAPPVQATKYANDIGNQHRGITFADIVLHH